MLITPTMASLKPSYIREILKVAAGKDVVSFAGGLPSPETFPMAIIEQAMRQIARDRSFFQYTQTSGHPPLLEQLYTYYNVPSTHEVLITSGAQQGLDLCARAFLEHGDTVVVENPSYLGALQILSMVGAHVVGVEQAHDGPNLEQLEILFKQEVVKFFYAVPDFHNPTGCCWSLDKRSAVADLCKKYQVLLIEDAPYRPIRFFGKELPTVSSMCPDEAIILYSFSKLISPGVRVAALVSPKRWSVTLNTLKQATDLHTNVPMQQLVLDIINHSGFEQQIRSTREIYKERYLALVTELRKLPSNQYSFSEITGGMFVWLRIPPCDVSALALSAIEHGVAVVPGSEFYIDAAQAPATLRLNFTHSSPDLIVLGMSRLIPVLDAFCGINR